MSRGQTSVAFVTARHEVCICCMNDSEWTNDNSSYVIKWDGETKHSSFS
jgi:hypothetical protein